MLIFDIETRPKSINELKQVLPDYDPASFGPPPREFDSSTVKTGNLKDQVKIDEKIVAARYDDDLAQAEANYWREHQSKAALAAETGSVAAIGYANDAGTVAIDLDLELSESAMLARFWEKWTLCNRTNRRIVGFNSNRFDIPFMVRRSWYLGVNVPGSVFTPTGYVAATSIDLLVRWQCGDRRSYVSLDKVCRACEIPGKPDDCSGEFFHAMVDDPATREAAINYLKNDLVMTLGLAKKMNVC